MSGTYGGWCVGGPNWNSTGCLNKSTLANRQITVQHRHGDAGRIEIERLHPEAPDAPERRLPFHGEVLQRQLEVASLAGFGLEELPLALCAAGGALHYLSQTRRSATGERLSTRELRTYSVDPGDMRTQMHQDAFPGEDISDRPPPEDSVPGLLALIEGDLPSGRYRARELAATASVAR